MLDVCVCVCHDIDALHTIRAVVVDDERCW